MAGYILDRRGLGVPGARVIVDGPQMPDPSVNSKQQGACSVPALMSGLYNLTIEATVFNTIHLDGVMIEANQRARLDFTLTTGSNTDIITVLGSAAS
jgi:hypothetical protein